MLTFRVIERAEDPLISDVREMFTEYERELGVDLCFQGFQEELAKLPGRYAPPGGVLLIADWNGDHAGCGALRDLGEGAGELKRIYVRPGFRGHGIGRAISVELVQRAQMLGFSAVKLDTLRHLTPAITLYRQLGFQDTAPYNDSPGMEILYMELQLDGREEP